MSAFYHDLEKSGEFPTDLLQSTTARSPVASFTPHARGRETWTCWPVPTFEEFEEFQQAKYIFEIEPWTLPVSQKESMEKEWYEDCAKQLKNHGWDSFESYLDSLEDQATNLKDRRDCVLQRYCTIRHEQETLRKGKPSDFFEHAEYPDTPLLDEADPETQYERRLERLEQETADLKDEAREILRLLGLLLWRRHIARAVQWHRGYLGDDRPWDKLQRQPASGPSGPFTPRSQDYLEAALELTDHSEFGSISAYARAIAKRAPKEDGTVPHRNTVHDWLTNSGFYEKDSNAGVSEVRARVENAARTYLQE